MLKDPPLLTIRRKFQRPGHELMAKLQGAQTGHIIDALEGRGALDHYVKPVDPEHAHFVGPALTCEAGANDNLAILAALVIAEPGDVIIAACDAHSATAVVGDNVVMMAKNKGVAAIVIDGMARDRDGIVPVGLPVFARGITPNSCVRSGPGRIGLPIVCGGVAVQAGDVLVGDRDGVVVIPRGDLQTVIDEAPEAAPGMFLSVAGVPIDEFEGPGAEFADKLKPRIGGKPVDPYAIYGAQAAAVMLDAIAQSDGTRADVLAKMFEVTVTDGYLGSFEINENGDPSGAEGAVVGFTIYKATDKLETVKTISPKPENVEAARG